MPGAQLVGAGEAGGADQLERVLTNVVQNAYEAIEGDGEIRVSARVVDAAVPLAEHVEIAVADDGRGMDEETLQRALVPFFTTKDRGSGLGLALSERLLGAQGGLIDPSFNTSTSLNFTQPILRNAWLQFNYANVRQARYAEAEAHYRRAADIMAALPTGEAEDVDRIGVQALGRLGNFLCSQAAYEEADRHLLRALTLAEGVDAAVNSLDSGAAREVVERARGLIR